MIRTCYIPKLESSYRIHMKGDVDIFRYAITGIKPFYATGLFLYPLKKIQKTSGLIQVSWFKQYIKFSPTKNFVNILRRNQKAIQ